jgi:hypothetical protein
MVWIDTDGAGTSARSLINDSDEDTWVNCETSTDNDVIKMGANSVLIYNASVDSTYPMLQILPYDHGNVQIAFDAYFDRDTAAWYSCSATANFSIAKNDTQEALQILSNTGDAVGSPIAAFNKTILKAKASGEVTMPNQPSFYAQLTTHQSQILPGDPIPLLMNVEVYDDADDYDTSTYTFTAPVTGKYQLFMFVRLDQVDAAADYVAIYITTSNRKYYTHMDPGVAGTTDFNKWGMNLSVIADMDANDTAFVEVRQSGGTQQMDVMGGEGNDYTGWGGRLLG